TARPMRFRCTPAPRTCRERTDGDANQGGVRVGLSSGVANECSNPAIELGIRDLSADAVGPRATQRLERDRPLAVGADAEEYGLADGVELLEEAPVERPRAHAIHGDGDHGLVRTFVYGQHRVSMGAERD